MRWYHYILFTLCPPLLLLRWGIILWYKWKEKQDWAYLKRQAELRALGEIDPEAVWVIVREGNFGDTWYLRYCSTTGEPIWEDRLTRDTETFRSRTRAQVEIDSYFLTCLRKATPRPVSRSCIPTEPVESVYYKPLDQ